MAGACWIERAVPDAEVPRATIGYMVSRGLAKAGSREPYAEQDDR